MRCDEVGLKNDRPMEFSAWLLLAIHTSLSATPLLPFPSTSAPLTSRNKSPFQLAQMILQHCTETCVCGGPTTAVSPSSAVVTLPSMPLAVQRAALDAENEETLKGLSRKGFVSNLSVVKKKKKNIKSVAARRG